MKKATATFNATTMRNILAFLMVILVIGASVGFYFGLQLVKSYALDVSHAVSDAGASGKNVEQLSVLKQQLAERETLITKANELFSTPDTYQAQALTDISKYASEAGVTISAFSKPDASSDGSNPSITSSYSEVITLQSPVSYAKLLQFLDAIEGNLPKMQITGISISRPADASGDEVATDNITITVATK